LYGGEHIARYRPEKYMQTTPKTPSMKLSLLASLCVLALVGCGSDTATKATDNLNQPLSDASDSLIQNDGSSTRTALKAQATQMATVFRTTLI